jgi:hypothetical protein
MLPTTCLNGVMLDLSLGKEGVAYIPESSINGPGALIVTDLAHRNVVRRLSGHPSTMPDPSFVLVAKGTAGRQNAGATPGRQRWHRVVRRWRHGL